MLKRNNTIFINLNKLVMQLRQRRTGILFIVLLALLLAEIMLRQLSSLTGDKLSDSEQIIASAPIGWHGLYIDSFHLPLKLIQSAGFLLFGQGGALVTRLPSVLAGMLAVVAVGLLLRAWHGMRIAILGTLLIACSTWTLHVSRHAGYDSSYLAAIPVLLVTQLLLQKIKTNWLILLVLIIWGLLLYVPGMVWLVVFAAWWQRDNFADFWKSTSSWLRRCLLVAAALAWIPLLAIGFARHAITITEWFGLPQPFGSASDIGRRFLSIPTNLFLHGPNLPDLWLGRLPLLDIFTISMAIFGIAYYLKHRTSSRSLLLSSYLMICIVLISLGGDVPISIIVPIFYLLAASGMALFLLDWTTKFPFNPIIRNIGFVFLTMAVVTSCYYNLQSYFVAWPHAQATISAFTHLP